MKILSKVALLCVALIAVTSCGSVALTGRNQLILYSDSDIAALADQSYEEFIKSATISTNATKTKQVSRVATNMVNAMKTYFSATGTDSYANTISWNCALVKSDDVNAFAMPNGRIVIYEGLTPVASSDAELAVVIGHEMAHIVARHTNERLSRQSLIDKVTTATSAAALAGGMTDGKVALLNAAMGLGGQYGLALPFSRKQEYEADRLGLIFMAIAGYDISAAPALWEKMSSGSNGSIPEYLSTHPSDANRIAYLNSCMEEARSYQKK